MADASHGAIAAFAAELGDCLAVGDADTALLGLADRPLDPALLDPSDTPHPLIALAAMLIAGAHLRRGMAGAVAPLLDGFSDALAPEGRKGEGNWRLLDPFPVLFAPLIDAALALKDQDRAIVLLNACRRAMRTSDDKMLVEPLAAGLLARPEAAAYGPFQIDWACLLDRHEQALALGLLDHRLADVQTFHAGLVESALLAEAPQRAAPLIDQELPWYLSSEVLDTSHFEFNAICVLAVLGRFNEALASARRLVRRGYHLAWRFRLASAQDMAWTQAMRQNEWLEALAQTPDYQRFLEEDLPGPMLGDEPAVNPLCVVTDGVWTGKKPKRCSISRKMIEPGEPVLRFRRLFNRASDGGLEMAAGDAFAASPWQLARQQFEGDAISLALLFPRRFTVDAKLNDAPYIHAFAHELARDVEGFDIARAVALIADHAPPAIGYTWEKAANVDRWKPAFPALAGADGHGDAVNFAWRIIKAGFREPMLDAVSALPAAKADKVFAMLATFDDKRLRQAAAEHFDLPDLPAMMALVFKDRLSLDDHETLAAFGDCNTRHRAALVDAMQAYGLHLYSNNRPKADWFLAGLERYGLAGGSALLYLLIDHPGADAILSTVVEQGWLPDKSAGADEYRNARPFYVRAALLYCARHRPEQLDAWLTPAAVARWCEMAHDRETLRLIRTYRKRKPPQPSNKQKAHR